MFYVDLSTQATYQCDPSHSSVSHGIFFPINYLVLIFDPRFGQETGINLTVPKNMTDQVFLTS